MSKPYDIKNSINNPIITKNSLKYYEDTVSDRIGEINSTLSDTVGVLLDHEEQLSTLPKVKEDLKELDKTVNGTTNIKREKRYMKGGSNGTSILGSSFNLQNGDDFKLVFTYDSPPTGATICDVSEKGDKSVVGYVVGDTVYVSAYGHHIYIKDMGTFFAPISAHLVEVKFENFHTEECTTFSTLFTASKLKVLDLSGFDLSSATSVWMMFATCTNLETIYADNWSEIYPNISSTSMFFNGCNETLKGAVDLDPNDKTYNRANYKNGYFTDPTLSPDYGKINNPDVVGLVKKFDDLKTIVEGSEPVERVDVHIGNFPNGLGKANTILTHGDIKRLEFTYEKPPKGAEVCDVTDSAQADGTILTWYDNETLYVSANGNHICTKTGSLGGSFTPITSNLVEIKFYNFHLKGSVTASGMFANCTKVKELDLSGFDVSNITAFGSMFSGLSELETIYAFNWTEINSTVGDTRGVFSDCPKLKGVREYESDTNSYTKNGLYANYLDGYFTDPALSPDFGKINNPDVVGLVEKIENNKISIEDLQAQIDEINYCKRPRKKVYLKESITDGLKIKEIEDTYSFEMELTYDRLPSKGTTTVNVAEDGSDPILLWLEDGVVYISGLGNHIYVKTGKNLFSPYGSRITDLRLFNFHTEEATDLTAMFSGCSRITSLDLSGFKFNENTNICNILIAMSNVNTIYAECWSELYSNDMVRPTSGSPSSIFSSTSNVVGNLRYYGQNCNKPLNCATYRGGYFTRPSKSPYFGRINNPDYEYMTSFELSRYQAELLKKEDEIPLSSRKKVYFPDGTSGTGGKIGQMMTTNTVKRVIFTYDYPPDGTMAYDVSLNSDMSVIGWQGEDYTVYISGLGNPIFVNGSLSNFGSPIINVEELKFYNFHTSEVSTFKGCFSNLKKLKTLDLSGWDLSGATNAGGMFSSCSELTTIYAPNWASIYAPSWSSVHGGTSDAMFNGCTNLSNAGFSYSNSKASGEYATTMQGYFTPPRYSPDYGKINNPSEMASKIFELQAQFEAINNH